jgi:hypothetical protein
MVVEAVAAVVAVAPVAKAMQDSPGQDVQVDELLSSFPS